MMDSTSIARSAAKLTELSNRLGAVTASPKSLFVSGIEQAYLELHATPLLPWQKSFVETMAHALYAENGLSRDTPLSTTLSPFRRGGRIRGEMSSLYTSCATYAKEQGSD